MRLTVKQLDRYVNEFRFTTGPIYIGRHVNSQIFLPGRAVSRQHAVIYATNDGKWMVEDLASANKTLLNDQEIQKAEIQNGDLLRITDFTIEVKLEDSTDIDMPIHLEDTLAPAGAMQIIVRRPAAEHAPAIKFPAKRMSDFAQATEAICKADTLDEMIGILLRIATTQFSAWHCWCALRPQPEGPMTYHAGKKRDGLSVELADIKFGDKITEAIDKGQFLLMPRIPAKIREQRIQSVMIAPVMSRGGCFGVIYIDNAPDHEHYTISDLDYLILLAIHTAVILENF